MVEPQSFVEGLRSELEGDSAAPLYHRLIKGFHRAMGDGALGIDVALPSERDSETFLGVPGLQFDGQCGGWSKKDC